MINHCCFVNKLLQMKILYYFPEQSTSMMQWQRIHFMEELSHYGIVFDVINPLLCDNFEDAQERTIKTLDKVGYDLFMTCLCNEKHIHPTTIEEIKKRGVPTLSFRPDNLSIPFNDKNLAATFDLLWLTSKDTQYLYDKWGAKTIFLPYAANPFTFVYNDSVSLTNRICFIGNPHGSRTSIINHLTQFGLPVDMFFGGQKDASLVGNEIVPLWEFRSPTRLQIVADRLRTCEGRRLLKGALFEKISKREKLAENDTLRKYPSLSFEEMIEKYSKYYLSLSFSSYAKTDVLKHNLPVVNLRSFEIPMCGGIQLCRYSEEMASLFDDGKEVVLYKDREEMIDKANYYLNSASDQVIFKMKDAARRRAVSEHTWFNRFRIVFDYLGLSY